MSKRTIMITVFYSLLLGLGLFLFMRREDAAENQPLEKGPTLEEVSELGGVSSERRSERDPTASGDAGFSKSTPENRAGPTDVARKQSQRGEEIEALVYGKAILKETGEPVIGAVIGLSSVRKGVLAYAETAVTDGSGEFFFPINHPGIYRWRAETETHAYPIYPSKHKPYKKYGYIKIRKDDEVIGPFLLELEPVKALEVKVVDEERGTPVAGASLLVNYLEPVAETNEKGRASLKLQPYQWTVKVRAAGYVELEKTIDLRGDFQGELVFQLRPGGVVHGRITDHNGQGLAGVRVSRGGPGMETNGDGYYSMEGVPLKAEFRLSFRHPDYKREVASPLQFGDTDTLEVNRTLKPKPPPDQGTGVFKVRVVNRDGEALEHASVRASGVGVRLPVVEEGGGRFTVEKLLEDEPYILYVRAGGYREERLDFKAVEPDKAIRVDVVLDSGVSLAGQVVDSDQVPIADAELLAMSQESDFIGFADSGPDGRFTFENLPEAVSLRVQHPLFSGKILHLNLEGQDLTVQLHPKTFISGRVVNKETGEPLKRFQLLYRESRTLQGMLRLDMPSSKWVEVRDPDGRFTIEKLNLSTPLKLSLKERGYHDYEVDPLAPWPLEQADQRRTFEMEPTNRMLNGVVVDGNDAPVPGVQILLVAYDDWMSNSGVWDRFQDPYAGVVSTDDAGRFSLPKPGRSKKFDLFLQGGGIARLHLGEVHKTASEEPLVIKTSREARISGVCNRDLYPDAHSIWLKSKKGDEIKYVASVGEDGGFVLEGLEPGDYLLEWIVRNPRTSRYQEEAACVSLILEEGDDLDLSLGFEDAFVIAGTALMGDQPVRNGVVHLVYDHPHIGKQRYKTGVKTDEAGRFAFRPVAAGSYHLVVFQKERPSDVDWWHVYIHGNRLPVELRSHMDQTFRFEPWSQVSGFYMHGDASSIRLTTTKGKWVLKYEDDLGMGKAHFQLTDVEPGEYRLSVWNDQGSRVVLPKVVVASGEPVNLGEVPRPQ